MTRSADGTACWLVLPSEKKPRSPITIDRASFRSCAPRLASAPRHQLTQHARFFPVLVGGRAHRRTELVLRRTSRSLVSRYSRKELESSCGVLLSRHVILSAGHIIRAPGEFSLLRVHLLEDLHRPCHPPLAGKSNRLVRFVLGAAVLWVAE